MKCLSGTRRDKAQQRGESFVLVKIFWRFIMENIAYFMADR